MKQEMRVPPNHYRPLPQMINLLTKALLLTFYKRLKHQCSWLLRYKEGLWEEGEMQSDFIKWMKDAFNHLMCKWISYDAPCSRLNNHLF